MSASEPTVTAAKPSKRVLDVAFLAPVIGLLMLIPPVIDLFAIDGTLFSAPVILVYLFGVWFGLIVAAALLARSLKRYDQEPRDPA